VPNVDRRVEGPPARSPRPRQESCAHRAGEAHSGGSGESDAGSCGPSPQVRPHKADFAMALASCLGTVCRYGLVPSRSVCLDHRSRDTSAVADLVPLGSSPSAHGLGIHVCNRTGSTTTPARAAHLATRMHVGVQHLAEFLGVLVRKVNLVVPTIEAEAHSRVRRFIRQVVMEGNDGLRGHDFKHSPLIALRQGYR
jgi:hypothetical protein